MRWPAVAFRRPPRCIWPRLRNQHAAARLLIERGADLDAREFPDNAAPLHFAAMYGDLEMVRLLVEAGADVEGKGDDPEVGILGWATCFRQVREDVAEYLLESWGDAQSVECDRAR